MSAEDRGKDEIAIAAAYLSPIAGLPLIGPWIVHAILPEESRARPHVARAFDLHLAAAVITIVQLVLGPFVWGSSISDIVAATFLLLIAMADVVLMIGALRRSSWADAWEPIVLHGRRFYDHEPFIRSE